MVLATIARSEVILQDGVPSHGLHANGRCGGRERCDGLTRIRWRNGIIRTFFPNLNETETSALHSSAQVVRSVIEQLEQ
jgi:hypothetical protein